MSAIVADPRFYHGYMMAPSSQAGSSGSSSSSGGSGYSDEDLLASLAGFAVEGQTERDLATIKAMLSSGGGGDQNTAANGRHAGGLGWPMQMQQQQQYCSNNPPPNTPTLSKSMELYGNPSEIYNSNGFPFMQAANRRRDVSLDRSYTGSSANVVGNSSFEMRDDTMQDSNGGELAEDSQRPSRHAYAGSSRPSMRYRKPSMNVDTMEGIEEESSRSSGGQVVDDQISHEAPFSQHGQSHAFQLASPPSSASGKRRQRTPPSPTSPPQTRSRARQQAAFAKSQY